EGKASASQLAPNEWSGFARGQFAEALALLDPPAALNLIQPLKQDELNRHAGNIAHKLAGTHPAEAEQAFKLIKRDNMLTPYSVRICYRMAAADLARAKRLAEDKSAAQGYSGRLQKPHAYGVMAMGLFAKDPATARQLLSEAF